MRKNDADSTQSGLTAVVQPMTAAAPGGFSLRLFFAYVSLLVLGAGLSAKTLAANAIKLNPSLLAGPAPSEPVMLGIDVLEARKFAPLVGKRVGLLTHPAGVNRRGVRTIDVLRRAPGVQLVTLFAVEHGLEGELASEKPFQDSIDARTGLKVISLYKGRVVKPTWSQLKGIDVLVIDLQDIGTRSYTFTGAMKTVMEACFENGKEVMVLDRPNPLGGLKVDGPLLDAALISDVGRFRVPYVHGLTIGELALMVRHAVPPGGLAISDAARAKGKLTVIPMRGWTRSMRWPETGLTWVKTSGLIQDLDAVEGYPMTGLGCLLGGFRTGIGKRYPFRGIAHPAVNQVPRAVLEKEFRALKLPGLRFVSVNVPGDRKDEAVTGIYIEITDYDAWRPTELNFHLMKLACRLEPRNPFAAATARERRTFNVHVGSAAFLNDLIVKGSAINLEAWLRTWREHARAFQENSRKYWLYR